MSELVTVNFPIVDPPSLPRRRVKASRSARAPARPGGPSARSNASKPCVERISQREQGYRFLLKSKPKGRGFVNSLKDVCDVRVVGRKVSFHSTNYSDRNRAG